MLAAPDQMLQNIPGITFRAINKFKTHAMDILAGVVADPLRVEPVTCVLCGESYKSAAHLRKHVESDSRCYMRLSKPFLPRLPDSGHNDVNYAGRRFTFKTEDGAMAASGMFPGNDTKLFYWSKGGEFYIHKGDWRDLVKTPPVWIVT